MLAKNAQQILATQHTHSTAIFQLDGNNVICLVDGTILLQVKKDEYKLQLPNCKIVCALLLGKRLAVGTTSGLYAIDIEPEPEKTVVHRVLNYNGIVGHLCSYNNAFLASLVEIDENKQVRTQSFNDAPDQIVYTIVYINENLEPKAEARGYTCCGLFDVAGDCLEIPEPGFIRRFKLPGMIQIDSVHLQQRLFNINHFLAGDLLITEKGFCLLINQEHKAIDFAQRVNQVIKADIGWYFALQCGQIRYMDANLSWRLVFETKTHLEITSLFINKEAKIIIVGMGRIQQPAHSGKILTAPFTGGSDIISIAE